jgi:hypothetical protein
MTKYWSPSFPRGNIKITVLSELIESKSTKEAERFFQEETAKMR